MNFDSFLYIIYFLYFKKYKKIDILLLFFNIIYESKC